MANRSALSIGDVLSLLREEFPDVTISKIRFLESQGLVTPERTQSGYRKFYTDDVTRLRWILRQQREHFLPLKVIRDRLIELNGAIPREDLTPQVQAASLPTTPPVTIATDALLDRDFSKQLHAIYDDSVFEQVRHLAHGDRAVSEEIPAATVSHQVPERRPAHGVAADAWRTSAVVHASVDYYETVEVDDSTVAPVLAVRPPAVFSAPGSTPLTSEDPRHFSGVSATEVSSLSGLSLADVAALKEFGFIEPQVFMGIESYSEEDVDVARLAAKFAEFGIGARHLKAIRYAVDREFGLIETVVLPLLRRRDAESHRQAKEASDRLVALSAALRDKLISSAIDRYLGA